MNVFQRFSNSLRTKTQNLFNQAFYKVIGNVGSMYDPNGKTYLKEGYQENSFVYSIIQAQAKKTASIPYFIKKVKDETKAKTFQREIKRSNICDPQTKIFLKQLENKAFEASDDSYEFPLKKPNVSQSWTEFIALYKTYMKFIGNAYVYMVMPEDGMNKGVPIAMYLLPAHLMNIVVKQNANYLIDEDPIDYYKLIEGTVYVDFMSHEVVHIKYPNPEFSMTGSHLYGQAPLKACLKNIESSNEAINQNIKTMKNSGAFGLIHGKTNPLTPDQAAEIKSRLTEMDNDPSRLSNIAGVSAEVGFTRMSLSTKDLMPFEFLNFDKKEIASCLNYMLIDSTISDYGGTIKEIKKENLVSDIMPDLGLLEEAFNTVILPKFKDYKNSVLIFDASTLPEMQTDMKVLVEWSSIMLLDGAINRNDYRENLGYPRIENNPDFERYTTRMGIVPLEETFMVDELIIDDTIVDDEGTI
jgi:HK97 family phage portal protein